MEKLTNIRSLLEALSRAMNLINPEVENHHQQAAYFAFLSAGRWGWTPRNCTWPFTLRCCTMSAPLS